MKKGFKMHTGKRTCFQNKNFIQIVLRGELLKIRKGMRVPATKRPFLVLWFTLLAFLVCLAHPAWGAVSISGVQVENKPVNAGDNLSVLKNTVTVSGKADQASEVKIGNMVESVTQGVYDFSFLDYPLKPGNNSIAITAMGPGGSAQFKFNIYYYAGLNAGAEYKVKEFPASGQIDAFNRAVTLVCPKDTLLLDSQGYPTKASIIFHVYDGPTSTPSYFTPAGRVFSVSVSQAVYLSQQGFLTLPYDPLISSVEKDHLTVWYNPDSPDNGWSGANALNLGGLVDERKKMVTIPFQFRGLTGYYAVFLSQQTFQERDLSLAPEESWAYPAVRALWAKGMVEPVTVGNAVYTSWNEGFFGLITDKDAPGTKKRATRLEFATMLVKGLGLPVKPAGSTALFEDVGQGFNPADCYASAYSGQPEQYNSSSKYFYPDARSFVETAARYGIVIGFPAQGGKLEFKPGGFLTREQAAVILARVANLKVSNDAGAACAALAKIFTDGSKISPWAAPSVLAAYQARLIAGIEVQAGDKKTLKFGADSNDPDHQLTRAQAITLAYRLFKKLKKI
ncbi:MAG: S-layer homology domain-containing protein [Desulfotomaculales bacterium]